MMILFIWIPSLIFLLSSLLLFVKTKTHENNKKISLPPPIPPKLPFLGHLHLIIASLPHRSFHKLSKKYGPVMLLKLGSVPTIIVSSASAARQLFKLHDLASCSRPPLSGTRRLSYNYLDISFSPYGHHWREVRKICVLELFSAKRVQSFQGIREQEVGLLLNSISHFASTATPVDLSQKSYSITANIITRIAFGKSFRGGELDNENFQSVVRRALAVLGSFSATDFFPNVGWIIDWVIGVRGRFEKSFAELDAFFQHVIDDRINNFVGTSSQNEGNVIVDVLLKIEREQSEFDSLQLTTDCIKALIMVNSTTHPHLLPNFNFKKKKKLEQ